MADATKSVSCGVGYFSNGILHDGDTGNDFVGWGFLSFNDGI
ncbi:MAG: hypothetical protein RR373_07130 [Akkermansia sp.]